MARCCSPEAFRIMLWMCWVTNMLITTVYYLLSFGTFYKLLQASGEAAIDTKALWMNQIWRAPLAATFLGGLLVLGFNMFSCVILLKKSINRSGPGFGYGFLVAFCFTLSFFMLLVALIMDSFRTNIKALLVGFTSWTKYSTELYVGAEVFAILTFIMLMIFFLCLVIFQGAVSDQLGISAEMANPYAPMGDHAGIALTSAAAMGISSADAAKSATTPQYGTYTAPELPSDNANFNNQFYSGPSDYQAPQGYQAANEYQANEYQTTEYTYEQEQGYQGQYQADGGYQTTYSADSAAQPAGAQFSQVQPPAYQSTDYNAAAAFHGQQGAFAGQAHQQL